MNIIKNKVALGLICFFWNSLMFSSLCFSQEEREVDFYEDETFEKMTDNENVLKQTSKIDMKEAPELHIERIVNVGEYCSSSFETEQKCPEDGCELRCSQQLSSRMCVLECLPKDCLDISSDRCPQETCLILKGCNDELICYPAEEKDAPECGDLAYAGDDVECCEGYVKRCGIEFFDGTCDMIGSGSLDSVPICIPCGNGICNQFENQCNCPEDCLHQDKDMLELLRSVRSITHKKDERSESQDLKEE